MAELDLGKVKATDAELEALILAQTGGVKFGKDEDGNPGYYKYDESAGADTFVPFSSGGGGGELILPDYIYSSTVTNVTSSVAHKYFYNNAGKYNKLRLVGYIAAKSNNASYTGQSGGLYFGGYAVNEDGSKGASKSVSIATAQARSTSYTIVNFDVEINYDEFWFPNSNLTTAPGIKQSNSGNYGTVEVKINQLILSK